VLKIDDMNKHVPHTSMGKMNNACKILIGKPHRKRITIRRIFQKQAIQI
jgi:hypothetical protein